MMEKRRRGSWQFLFDEGVWMKAKTVFEETILKNLMLLFLLLLLLLFLLTMKLPYFYNHI